METPYKQGAVFRFGSPSIDITKDNPVTPDILKFLPPSLLILSSQKEDENMSPILGISVFKNESDDLGNVLSTPTEAVSRRCSTRRRLLSDAEQTTIKSDEDKSSNNVFLQRLQSNPMFGELSKILAEECLHMQTPTNLINVTWDASCHNKRTRNVHVSHLRLQKKFLQFRSQERYQVSALEIESRYSREISKLEIDRYVELSLTMSPEHANIVHDNFDHIRLQLVNQANNSLDELLVKLTTQEKRNETQCKRRLNNSVSPVSETLYDSGLSSDDNSVDNPIKSERPQVDVLKLAMTAADVLPVPDTQQHNFNHDHTFSDITSLLETFPVPRQDVIHCQPTVQKSVHQSETLKSRPVLKRKLENTDDSMGNQTKKLRSENTTSKPRQITPEATRILNEWYDNHVQYPYPTDGDVNLLVQITSLSSPQVKKWMANKRVRCFNTLSITGNKHPIKSKLAGKKKTTDIGNTYKQLSDQSKRILGDWYEQHSEHPYPTETEKELLASAAGITLTQVKSWFANRRSRANNRRRQVPNYFLEKFPEYTSHVQMVQVHRDQTRRRNFTEPEIHDFQNCYF